VPKLWKAVQLQSSGITCIIMISVVLPCYNRGALLPHAIDSVLAQGAYARQIIVVWTMD
jgi:Glycosyl transferase family 2